MIIFGHSGPGADDKWNLLCSPDCFVSFSEAQKKWTDKYKLPWTKSIVITHAVDLDKFKPVMKNHRKNVVLCVAANTPNKRVSLVRNAVNQIKNVKLIVVGSGQEIVVDYNEMPGIYNNASVFCFVPEKWEAFGLVYLEALACNLPVVTIDDEVRREIVGEAGLLVKDPNNTLSLSQALDKALSTDWGTKPRNQAKKFSWDLIVNKYNLLFKHVTNV